MKPATVEQDDRITCVDCQRTDVVGVEARLVCRVWNIGALPLNTRHRCVFYEGPSGVPSGAERWPHTPSELAACKRRRIGYFVPEAIQK